MNDTNVNVRKPRCEDWSPSWFKGHWRDWHRGHDCSLDDGKPRTPAGAEEIAKGGSDHGPRRA